jgi:hypothetical protein
MAEPVEEPGPGDDAAPTPVTCAWCGTTADGAPLTWSTSFERGRVVLYCDRCSRDHLRSLEAKLDPEYW